MSGVYGLTWIDRKFQAQGEAPRVWRCQCGVRVTCSVSTCPLCGMRRAWAETPVHGRAHAAKRLTWMAQLRAELAEHKRDGNRALEFGCRQAWDACWDAARAQADETWRLPG